MLLFVRRVVILTVVVKAYHSDTYIYNFIQHSSLKIYSVCDGIIRDHDVIDQPLRRYCATVRYCIRNGDGTVIYRLLESQ